MIHPRDARFILGRRRVSGPIMIDENLMRAELDPALRAKQAARREVIYIELHPETGHGGDRRSDQVANFATRSERFTADTDAKTGKSERVVQRAASCASLPRQSKTSARTCMSLLASACYATAKCHGRAD